MKPSDCKTAIQAEWVARGINEARIVAYPWTQGQDRYEKLLQLELSYWRRSEELRTKKAPTRPAASRKGRKL